MVKKAVVTGGAGFIGSHIVELLLKKDYSVVIVDNLATGNKQNIDHLLANDKLEFVEGSILDLDFLQKTFAETTFVFHEGAIPSVPRSVNDPITSHDVNASGTLNVLVAARDNNVKKLVYASSSSVYGDTPTLPKSIDMPTNPLSPYAVSKLAGECYCNVFSNVYNLPTVSLRYFNVFGPRQNPESQYAAVIPKFIKLLLNEEAPVIFGDGKQTRDFTFVKDVAAANLAAAESDATGVFNIARGDYISLTTLVQMIASIMNKDIKPQYTGERAGDIKHSFADISLSKKMFGYNPVYSLEEGITETVEYLTHLLQQ